MTTRRRRVYGHPRHAPIEIRVKFAPLPPEDVTLVRGLRVTTVTRTLIDLAGVVDRGEAVALVRQALDKGLVPLEDLRRAAERRTDLKSIHDFREVLRLLASGS